MYPTVMNMKNNNNQLSEIIKSFSQIQIDFAERIQTLVSQFKEASKLSPEIIEGIRVFVKALEYWPEWQKEYWLKASEFGWYFNWHTPASSCLEATDNGKEALDIFMMSHLEFDWDEIIKEIIHFCPERKEILNEAFLLHSEGRFTASIPLLISQTDGICAECLGTFLFSEHDRRLEKIESDLQNSEDKALILFLSLLKNKNQFSKGIGKCSSGHKEMGPNRSGILHGSKKHLDYGTEINSLKCFSLLAFVVFTLLDHKNKKS